MLKKVDTKREVRIYNDQLEIIEKWAERARSHVELKRIDKGEIVKFGALTIKEPIGDL